MAAAKKKSIDEEQVKEWIERGVKKFENMDCTDKKWRRKACSPNSSGCLWFLGFVGSAIYFLQQATTFWVGVVGILKAIVWPAFLIYYLFGFLKI